MFFGVFFAMALRAGAEKKGQWEWGFFVFLLGGVSVWFFFSNFCFFFFFFFFPKKKKKTLVFFFFFFFFFF